MAGAEHHNTGVVPFWVHQLTELLLALLLLVQGARSGDHTAALVGLGAILLLLALCSEGAFGAWPWIGRRLHRVLDLVVAALLALSPLLLSIHEALAIVVLEAAALSMVWLALRTAWKPARSPRRSQPAPAPVARDVPKPPAPRSTTPLPAVAPAPAAPTPPVPPAAPKPRTDAGPPLARRLGSSAARVRDDGPRRLGHLVGRARNAAKAAMASSNDDDAPAPPAPAPEGPEPPDAPGPPSVP